MAYIFNNTDYMRVEILALNDSSWETQYIYLRGYIKYKPVDEDDIYENLNNEIIIDNIGQRASIEIEIINNTKYNSLVNILKLFNHMNKIKAGTHIAKVYPFYDADAIINTLDSFECILDGYYDVERLHQTVQSGNSITIKFLQRKPSTNFIPKYPLRTNTNTIQVVEIGMISNSS